MPVPVDPFPNFVPGTLIDADQVDARLKKLYDTLDPAVSGIDPANIRSGGLYAAVSALPSSPTDGQECYYLADGATSTVWHLRFRSSTGRWEFVGGRPLFSRVDAAETVATTLNAWGDITTAGPDITVPLAGDYEVEFGATLSTGADGQAIYAGIAVGIGGTPSGNRLEVTGPFASVRGSFQSFERFTGLAGNALLRMRYQAATVAGGAPQAKFRWMRVWPWRF